MIRPRVLILMTGVFAKGGIQRFNRNLLCAIQQLGIDADVCSLGDVPAHAGRVRTWGSSSVWCAGGSRIRFVWAITRLLWRARYTHVVVGHVNLMRLAMHAVRLQRPSPQVLLIAHGTDVWDGITGSRRMAVRRADRILCVSNFTRDAMLAQAPELGDARFEVFPNVLSPDWLNIKPVVPEVASGNTHRDRRFILSVARLDSRERAKGIDTTIRALAQAGLEELDCLIAGQGDDVDRLRMLAEEVGVGGRVQFLGSVSDEALAWLYRNCAAFVLPSAQEGFGIVYLEAMFFGALVIAAREKGVVDVVQHGETGLLVPYGDTATLADALRFGCAPGERRDRIRAQATQTVVGTGAFSYQSMVERCSRIFSAG